MRPIADPADVHPRAQPDMLQRRKRFDFAVVVNVLGSVCHNNESQRWYSFVALPREESVGSAKSRNPKRKANPCTFKQIAFAGKMLFSNRNEVPGGHPFAFRVRRFWRG